MAQIRLCELAECMEQLGLVLPAAGADRTVTAAVGRRMLLLATQAWLANKEHGKPAAKTEGGNLYALAFAEHTLAESELALWTLITELKEVVAGNPDDQAKVIAAIRADVEAAMAEATRGHPGDIERAGKTIGDLLKEPEVPPQERDSYPPPEKEWAVLPEIGAALRMPMDKENRVSRVLYRLTRVKKKGKKYGNMIPSLAREVIDPGQGPRVEYCVAGVWAHLRELRLTKWAAIPATVLPAPAAR